MTSRYRQLFNLRYCDILYSSFVNERDRLILTRWRLSCHQLRIKTGRYERPPVPRDERLCTVCFVLEDETHALFHCKCHIFIRYRHTALVEKFCTTSEILHPNTVEDVARIALYLKDIEENMTRLKMI